MGRSRQAMVFNADFNGSDMAVNQYPTKDLLSFEDDYGQNLCCQAAK